MNNPDIIQDVTDFMLAMGQSRQVLSSPEIPEPDIQTLRSKLNREEYGELTLAWDACAEARKRMEAALRPETPTERKARLASTYESITPPQQKLQEIAAAQAEALADLADGIADLIYVLVGHANAYGIPLAKVWREVQRANMAKLWTDEEWDATVGSSSTLVANMVSLPNGEIRYAVRRPDGKVAKPPSFQPPDIKRIILDAMGKAEPPDYEP